MWPNSSDKDMNFRTMPTDYFFTLLKVWIEPRDIQGESEITSHILNSHVCGANEVGQVIIVAPSS